MDIASVNTPRSDLSEGPPLPAQATRRPTMHQLAGAGDQERGLGMEGGSPQVQALEGMQMAERGLQLIATSLPDLAPGLAQLLEQLRQAIPRAMGAAAQSGPGQAMPVSPPPPGMAA